MIDLYVVVGPTAVGKTRVGIELAKKINGEIISLDSMQIYKYLNIGTAKIMPEEMEGIKHHLIDIVEPNQNFSVADYVEFATKVIEDINKRGKKPILVGGTGLYFESLIFSYTFSNAFDLALRKNIEKELEEIGKDEFYKKLLMLDRDEALKIHPNNTKRMIRAMEICLLTQSNKTNNMDVKDFRYNIIGVFLNSKRDVLYENINKRVDLMFENGLTNELNYLINQLKLNFNMQSMKAIGYREFEQYFNGNISLNDVIELIKLDSRHYAKRQITWFKRYNFIKEIYVDDKSVNEILNEFEG